MIKFRNSGYCLNQTFFVKNLEMSIFFCILVVEKFRKPSYHAMMYRPLSTDRCKIGALIGYLV